MGKAGEHAILIPATILKPSATFCEEFSCRGRLNVGSFQACRKMCRGPDTCKRRTYCRRMRVSHSPSNASVQKEIPKAYQSFHDYKCHFRFSTSRISCVLSVREDEDSFSGASCDGANTCLVTRSVPDQPFPRPVSFPRC